MQLFIDIKKCILTIWYFALNSFGETLMQIIILKIILKSLLIKQQFYAKKNLN